MSIRLNVDAVVLTALGLEFGAIRAHLTSITEIVHKGTVYEVGQIGDDGPRVAIAETGAGNVNAGIEAERAMDFFQPRLLLFVGVAGGVKDAALGDVVAATKVYGYETAKEEETLRLRPDVGVVSYELEQRARAVARLTSWRARRVPPEMDLNPSPQAFVGAIAAGEKIIASTASRTYSLIRESLNDTLAVEMEGIGTLRAVRANAGVKSIIIRGISDLLDDKGLADSQGFQPVAAASAAAFAVEVIVSAQNAAGHVGSTNRSSGDLKVPVKADSNDILMEAEQIAAALYDEGPKHDEIWSRAGGDVASLTLSGNGRTMWHRAFAMLRKGGGGTTSRRLLDTMAEDYPHHAGLSSLRGRHVDREPPFMVGERGATHQDAVPLPSPAMSPLATGGGGADEGVPIIFVHDAIVDITDLSGFEPHHKPPQTVDAQTRSFVKSAFELDAEREVRDASNPLREAFGFRARNVTPSVNQQDGYLRAPGIEFKVSASQDQQSPRKVLVRRELQVAEPTPKTLGLLGNLFSERPNSIAITLRPPNDPETYKGLVDLLEEVEGGSISTDEWRESVTLNTAGGRSLHVDLGSEALHGPELLIRARASARFNLEDVLNEAAETWIEVGPQVRAYLANLVVDSEVATKLRGLAGSGW